MSGKPVRPRTRLGKYELGKTIGEGSFAKVKFAKNVENGDHVAIKILNRSHVLSHKMTEQVTMMLLFNQTLRSLYYNLFKPTLSFYFF